MGAAEGKKGIRSLNEVALAAHSLSVGYKTGRFNRTVVLQDVDLDLKRGEFVCMLGPNGTGKSTLLRTFGRMQPPFAGSVEIDGRNIHHLSNHALATLLSVVLTDRLSVGRLTAYELISLGRYPYTGWAARLTRNDHKIIQWAIGATRSHDLAARDISELSDGERQRVMIARALAQQPTVTLLDEPTAFLDLPTRVEITGLLKRLTRETGLAVLMSTHDLDLALRSADTLWLITPEGRVEHGAPEDLILRETLQSTFSSSELIFDSEIGGFMPLTPAIGNALLIADGLSGMWMRRALEREGFRVFDSRAGEDIDVEIVANDSDEDSPWRLKMGNEEHHCSDIGSLVSRLRSLH
ncbi:MAG: ABC transporter ATP-binding protein [Chloroflexi bacterium]|nr:ABC transporter ATP-binding protein [Chloroflexota bacterium]